MALDTYAEVLRLCTFVASTKCITVGEFIAKVVVATADHGEFVEVRQSDGFSIHTNGLYYVVIDGHIQSLYKLINHTGSGKPA